jgi:thioredoxin
MNTNQEKALTIEVGEAEFRSQVLKAKQPVLVAFWAPWSRPCHILESALDEVASACVGRVKVVKVNADDHPELSMWFDVQSIPTLLFFVAGHFSARIVGTASKEAIISRLEAVSRGGDAPSLTPCFDIPTLTTARPDHPV